ncbi:MAG: type II toxin-antitoxin system HicB family antitoxin [Candidatus Caenarcaniphilales bacterium]|jgi:predicted RNase H-like HicB family nuclease|nr:type II toxin-antitoxin system HicB family antitoxin [Candidatus Caenarcaniphilales bacterium]
MAKKNSVDRKIIEQYLKLPYSFTVAKDQDEDDQDYYYASVNELPGCVSDGQSPEEALKNIKDSMYDWIETALINDDKIPEPNKCSGKFSVRIPPSLHQDLVKKTQREGVSINQFITTAIARAVGY